MVEGEGRRRAPRAKAAHDDQALLAQLIAGQARSDQRFEEMFRRLGRAESTAAEARDLGREMVTILREQDVAGRLTEMRGEMIRASSDLRQDVVAANNRLREDLASEVETRAEADKALDGRLEVLETARSQVIGLASFFGWAAKVGPWLLAAAMAFLAGREGGGA